MSSAPGVTPLPSSQLQFVANPQDYAALPAEPGPERATDDEPQPRSHLLRTSIWLIVLGAVAGVAWALLVPRGRAVWNGVEWLALDPDLWLRQDITFAALMAVLGLGTGIYLAAVVSRPNPVRRLLAILVASGLGTLAALGVGRLIVPPTAAQTMGTEGAQPLVLHALGFAGTWPLLAMATCAIVLVVRSFTGR